MQTLRERFPTVETDDGLYGKDARRLFRLAQRYETALKDIARGYDYSVVDSTRLSRRRMRKLAQSALQCRREGDL